MIDLNDIAAPKTRHDLAAVKERLACTAADWLPGLFPEARLARDRRSLRCADLSGRPPRKEGSCTIHLDGPYAGWGFDYATGERAGPIDLIAQATGLCDGALFDEAARLAGIDHPAPRPAPASPMRARPDHSAEIARLLSGAVPIAGTPAETYLCARGVSDPGSPDLLFHPDLPDFDSCRGWPGLIAILRLPDGTRAPGIHRTFLLDDGSAKAPPGKKMLGSVKDAVVRLFPMPEDGHIGIAEGIETALAAHALFGTPIWAALSADGLARFQWPEGTRRVTIHADAGDAGRQAVATLSDRLNRADIPNEIVAPLHGDDFNDDLLRGARAEDYVRPADTTAEPQDGDPVEPETATPVLASADDPATLIAAAEALTNPPEFEALATLLGRIALAKLDPLPERQVIARIKSATGIGMSVLTQQLAELRRRVNATGDPHAPIPKPTWFRRLRLDLAGAPERNEANVIVALTSDPAFAGVLAFDDLLLRVAEDDAADLAQHLGDGRVMRLRAVTAGRLDQTHAVEFGGLAQHADVAEALTADGLGIGLVLGEDRHVLRQGVAGGLIPVIFVQVGDDHGVHVDDLGHRQRQMHHRVGLVAVHGAREAGKAVPVRQHRIDEEANASIDDLQRGVADLGDLAASGHGLVSLSGDGKRTSDDGGRGQCQHLPACGHVVSPCSRSARDEGVGGDDFAIEEGKRRHQGRMDLVRGDGRAVEVELARGAGIVDRDGLVAEVIRGSDRCIDAHVAHGADSDDFLDPPLVEQSLEAGLAEGVREVLGDDRLALAGGDRLIDLHPVRAGDENRGAGHLVPHVHDEIPGLTAVGDDAGGVCCRGIDAFERQVAAGPVFVLEIDHDDGALGHG